MHIELIKRKKGTVYKARAKGNGQIKTKIFARKIDAHKWALETEGLLKDIAGYGLTFQQLSETWLQNHSKIRKAPSSQKTDKRLLQDLLPLIGNKAVSDISGRDIEYTIGVLASKTKNNSIKKRSNGTINKYIMLAQTILNYGVRNDYLIKSPIRRHHFLPEDEKGYQFWTMAEAEMFLNHAERKYQGHNRFIHLLYLTALNTGMRWGEIIALKWDCVYFDKQAGRSHIKVARTYCNTSQKVRETTKGHKIRVVGLNDVLLNALKDARERQNLNTDFVFHTQIETPLRVGNIHRRNFKRDIKEAGVTPIRFHDLRHTFASHYVMNGGSLYDLQKILGHCDVQMTMRYAHLSKEHILSKSDIVVIGKRDNVIAVDFKSQQAANF